MKTLPRLSPDQGGSPGQRDRRLPAERVWRGRRGPGHQRQDQGECSNSFQRAFTASVAPPNAGRLRAGDDPVRSGGQRPGVPGQRQEDPRQENKVGNHRRYPSQLPLPASTAGSGVACVSLQAAGPGVSQQTVEIFLESTQSVCITVENIHCVCPASSADRYIAVKHLQPPILLLQCQQNSPSTSLSPNSIQEVDFL